MKGLTQKNILLLNILLRDKMHRIYIPMAVIHLFYFIIISSSSSSIIIIIIIILKPVYTWKQTVWFVS